MNTIQKKLYDFCDIFRDKGMSYGDFIEQLTYLLFIKVKYEQSVNLPENSNWDDLIEHSGSDLKRKYIEILETLERCEICNEIFAGATYTFTEPAYFKKLITFIDETDWTSLDKYTKTSAYEGLLEKYASREEGAGRFFTPRTLIRSIIRCINLDATKLPNYTIHDPACGTCGFLVEAFTDLMKKTEYGSTLQDSDKIKLTEDVFSGMDNNAKTRRLGFMNCFLHELKPKIRYGDSLGDGIHVDQKYDLILTNPRFGINKSKSSLRDDFIFDLNDNELNFIQHVKTILKSDGECVMIVPDSVFFSKVGKSLREDLLKTFNLHTILKLPMGTFAPYSPGINANVIFFTKGYNTNEVWIYDLRTNISTIAVKNPLTDTLFKDFEDQFNKKPRMKTERFQNFSFQKISSNDFDLNFKFMKDDAIVDVPKPDIIMKEMTKNLDIINNSFKKLNDELIN